MTLRLPLYVALVSALVFSSIQAGWAQTILPMDSAEGLIIYQGNKVITPSSKKNTLAVISAWAGEKQVFPPMVFSTINQSKSRIVLKAVTEVPSLKGLHPISFKLDILVSRKSFDFRADNFYFEDITLSLEEWLKKYGSSDNERHIKNVDMISKEIDSYIFLTLEDLKKRINSQ